MNARTLTRFALPVYLGVLVWASLMVTVAEAVDPVTNPVMELEEGHGFQHVIAEGDLLILIRYELPKSAWRIDTADVAAHTSSAPFIAYMEEGKCHDDDEANLIDFCYTSLFSGVALHSFYDGPQDTATLQRSRTVPRVSHGISGVYLGTGHGLTFGDATYRTCLEGSATLFSPRTVECEPLIWHDIATSTAHATLLEAGRATNGDAFVSIAENLQTAAAGLREQIVVNQLITPTGAIYFKEAYTNIARAAPGAFAVSQPIAEDIVLATADTAAEDSIQAEASGSLFFGVVRDFNDNHLGGTLPVSMVGSVLIGMIALFVMVVILAWVKSMLIAVVIAALFFFGFGVLNDLANFSLYLIMLLMLFTVGVFKYMRGSV